jgi:hypothetical protein
MLYASLLVLATGCASIEIPNIKLHAEIPFIDGSEAVFVETVSKKHGLIPFAEWTEQRPYMLMIHIRDWAEIKKTWLSSCRSFREKCNVAVDSIDEAVRKIDNLAREVYK